MAANVERLREQAERIKQLRREKERRDGRSISQETAAHEIGVSSRTYRTWEGQGATLQFDNLKALADYYGTSTGYIEHGQHLDTPSLAGVSQLDRIEQKLDRLLNNWAAVAQDTPDDALAYLQRVTGFMRGVLEPDPPARDTTPAPKAAKGQSRRTRRVA